MVLGTRRKQSSMTIPIVNVIIENEIVALVATKALKIL